MSIRSSIGRRTALAAFAVCTGVAAQQTPHPILFVTQYPVPDDFATIGSVFANHLGSVDSVGRGGDLYIRYGNGNLRNLTEIAGFGNAGAQRENSIAVRDPAVSWDGTKAIFSMVVGAPLQQYVYVNSYWQLYEVTGLGESETPVITKVANQPSNRNNVSPAYLSDNSIVFVSDRTRNGAGHLYPQLDEYESTPTPTGLWRLQPATGQLDLLQYSVSGAFTPLVDSFGRLLFTRWDHLQRDQQNDSANNANGAFNWSGEGPAAAATADRSEVFPEPRIEVAGSGVNGYTINHFFPWMVNQDGTEEETLNHVGRHELHSYFNRSFNDPALVEFSAGDSRILNLLQLREDPLVPGRYYGIDAPEFYTHASGQLVRIDAAPSVNPAQMRAVWLNPRVNVNFSPDYAPVPTPADFTGHFRNPLPLSDGQLIAAHATEWREAGNDGTREAPQPRYQFRLKRLVSAPGGYFVAAGNLLANPIVKSVSFWDPDYAVSYNGPMWELSPVEVRARTVPPSTALQLRAPELAAFSAENVDVNAFRSYLRANGLALLVVRNTTTRDRADKQQPYNLRVPGGTQTVGSGGQLYDIAHMQFFQGDQIRSLGGTATPRPGRRVLAQAMHDGPAMRANAANPGGPAGSTAIASDGSVAAFVPAQRAMAWHATAPNGTPVVRERYWISFQPGEIRACDGCHGVNQQNQANPAAPAAVNTPQALRQLLARWRDREIDQIFSNGTEERR